MKNKPAYTLVHGIIPGPNAPNVTNISNILKPLVNELLQLKGGIEIETYKHPLGQKLYIQFLPLLGDFVAVHKAARFASHPAKQFCPWCQLILDDISKATLGTWCTDSGVLEAAQEWNSAKSAM
ncbi:hypothetical protein O181_119772 [Austropuccinia psidii MF-1]|uniref:Uncharacterized protein n=1 Tax=Austropuccinia psidii MF-1 TaxID=1389203 RepID=A0A9Q3Q1R8_9BASI|nr:hypothetical protein [Austropuccinia psidii MF-1]